MAAGGHFENAQLPEFARIAATPPPKSVNTTYVRTQFHGQNLWGKIYTGFSSGARTNTKIITALCLNNYDMQSS